MASTDFTNGVTLSDAGWADDVDCSAYSVLFSVTGTNTLTATGPATYTYASTRPAVWITPAFTNTSTATLNVTPSGGAALGAKNVFYNGVQLAGGELRAGVPTAVIYDGTQFNIAGRQGPILGTEQTTTGVTALDITGVPAWAKEINVNVVGLSTNSTSELYLQLGDSGGIETTGYSGSQVTLPDAVATNGNTTTTAFFIADANASSATLHGTLTLRLEDAAQFTWVLTGVLAQGNTASLHLSGGSKSLSAALDRLRITTASGTDQFDAGSVNVAYS